MAKKTLSTKKKVVTPTPAKKTTKSPKKIVPSIEFTLYAPDAKTVCVAGDFTNWQTEGHNARKLKDGVWHKKFKLKPGRYEYLFFVDGQWWCDPQNVDRVRNTFGSENSVIIIPNR